MAIHNVALAGASGNIGPSIVEALINDGFNVTVLVRPSSKATYPSNVKVSSVDFDSVESLTSALKGQDAVVCTLPVSVLGAQDSLIEAAIAAGVNRFVPSEFGGDPENSKYQALPVFAWKVKAAKYLERKAAEGKITYTLFANGALLDWNLKTGFLVNFKPGSEYFLHDGGDRRFAATLLADVGKGIVGVLKNPEETKNRTVRVNSVVTTNNELLAIGKKLNPDPDVKIVHVNTEQLEKDGREIIDKAKEAGEQPPRHVFQHFTRRALFGEGFNGALQPDDDALLGIEKLSDEDLMSLLAPYAKAS